MHTLSGEFSSLHCQLSISLKHSRTSTHRYSAFTSIEKGQTGVATVKCAAFFVVHIVKVC